MATPSDVSGFYAYMHEFSESVDIWRGQFNRRTGHLESWQVVCYTFSLIFLVAWIRKITSSEISFFDRFNRKSHAMIRNLPWVRPRFDEILANTKNLFEEETHKDDFLREFYKFLPERGLEREDIVREAKQYALLGNPIISFQNSTDDRGAEAIQEVTKIFQNANSPKGIRKMESEVVKMVSTMMHAGHGSSGVVTSGNPESVLLVYYAARRKALAESIESPEILLPISAHPVFQHLADMMRFRVVKVPVYRDDRVDYRRLRRRITSSTALIVASAPNSTTGTMDDINKISELAARYKIPFHVDASTSGFLLPFLEMADFHQPHIDFRLSGVTSIAVDLHGYGQSTENGSVLIFKDQSWLKHHTYISTKNRTGVYVSPTLNPNRNASVISAAWATLLSIGRDGYVDITSQIVTTTRRMAELMRENKEIEILGAPELCLIAFRSTAVDTYALGEKLIDEGWELEVGENCLRLPITLEICDDDRISRFIADLKDSVEALVIDKGYAQECKTAALHRMIDTSADQWLVNEILRVRLIAEHSMPPPEQKTRPRTVSVDGRKMSMLGSKPILTQSP
ncbi:unnamed protein product, partial [Mesorhabditis spiculigera]